MSASKILRVLDQLGEIDIERAHVDEIKSAYDLIASRNFARIVRDYFNVKYNNPDSIEEQERIYTSLNELSLQISIATELLSAKSDLTKTVLITGGTGVVATGIISTFSISVPPLGMLIVGAGAFAVYRGHRENMDIRRKLPIYKGMEAKIDDLLKGIDR